MNRKTKNACLLDVVKRQEREIATLQQQIAKLKEVEQIRDAAWEKYTDARVKEINTAIRSAKK